MIDVDSLKKGIVEFLTEHGPALPIKIAKHIEQELVFTSALLGELTGNKRVRASNMKVGSSQIYYLPGQEKELEKFADEHLNGMVKDAYLELRQNKYLIDQNESPAVRVALRSLKDFATPFTYKDQMMWRYNFVPKEVILEMLSGKPSQNQTSVNTSEESKKEALEKPEEKVTESAEESSSNDKPLEKSESQNFESPFSSDTPSREDSESQKQNDEKESSKDNQESVNDKNEPKSNEDESEYKYEFTQEVFDFLEKKNIGVKELIEESKSECVFIGEVNSDLGPIEYLVIGRSRKSINDSDLRAAKSRATEKHMPCYLLHIGKVTKAGTELLEEFKNVLKVDIIA